MPRSAKRRKSFKDNLIVYDSMSDKPGMQILIKSYNPYKNLRVQQNFFNDYEFKVHHVLTVNKNRSVQRPLIAWTKRTSMPIQHTSIV